MASIHSNQRTAGFCLALTFLFALQSATNAFTTTPVLRSIGTTTTTIVSSKTALFSSTEQDAAEKLREKAAAIRAEIAAMEGKTVKEVEDEARQKREDAKLRQQESEARRKEDKEKNNRSNVDDGRYQEVPSTPDDMVRQAARAVERAFVDGVTRQTVRFALIREDQYVNDDNQWPGGAQEMAREAAKPLTKAMLKLVHAPTKEGEQADIRLPPTIKDQDIWDFDGSSLITAEAKAGGSGDVQAMVLPNTDVKYTNDIEAIDKAMGKRLFLLVNPFWRNLESWGINILAPGAKQKAKEIIFDRGYDETYSLLRFSCRGEECVALKAYPYDWQIYAYREDENNVFAGAAMETTIRLGSCKDEPSSEYVTALLNDRPEFKDTRTMRKLRKL